MAIIGIYYLREGPRLKREIQYLLDNDIREKGEYQLTNALQRLKDDGARIVAGKVDAWWDCGNKDAVLDTNARVLDYLQGLGGKARHPQVDDSLRHSSARLVRTQVIEPCYLGANVVVEDSVIGPYVSLGDNVQVRNSVMHNTILREDTTVAQSVLADSLIGRNATVTGQARVLDLGDFSRS
jgi:glucose-1-phosphate thymidylyltransferase